MFRSLRRLSQAQVRRHATFKTFPTSGFQHIPADTKVEEETLGYPELSFFPIRIGQVFEDRWQVVAKLGWGGSATVWLCRDYEADPEMGDYVSLKVYAHDHPGADRELAVAKAKAISPAIQPILTSVLLKGPTGSDHYGFIGEALGPDVGTLKEAYADGKFPRRIAKYDVWQMLRSLQDLHGAGIAHCDLRLPNCLFRLPDERLFAAMEAHELSSPSTRKILANGHTIHTSLEPTSPLAGNPLHPVLTDFGEARYVHKERQPVLFQPDEYRAPEVIFGTGWPFPVDVWNFGQVLWHLFQGEPLFQPYVSGGYSSLYHLTLMGATFGLPSGKGVFHLLPQHELRRQHILEILAEDGSWYSRLTPDCLKAQSLESKMKRLDGPEKEEFLNLVRRMLVWDPSQRSMIPELLGDLGSKKSTPRQWRWLGLKRSRSWRLVGVIRLTRLRRARAETRTENVA